MRKCSCFRFGVDLQISDKLFVMDAGASNSKDIKLLRSHLQELRTSIISVSSASTHTRRSHTGSMNKGPKPRNDILLTYCSLSPLAEVQSHDTAVGAFVGHSAVVAEAERTKPADIVAAVCQRRPGADQPPGQPRSSPGAGPAAPQHGGGVSLFMRIPIKKKEILYAVSSAACHQGALFVHD